MFIHQTVRRNRSEFKIIIKQVKYACGDSYDENGIEGYIGYLSDNLNLVVRRLEEEYRWGVGLGWSMETGAKDEYDGQVNMDIIKQIPDWESLYPAFAACDALNINGITGWYLPSINECRLCHSDNNWSSTEYDGDYALINKWGVEFKQKHELLEVIAVHKF